MPFVPLDDDLERRRDEGLPESASLDTVQLDVDVGDTAPGSGNLTTGDISGGERVKELLESLSASSGSATAVAVAVIP